MEQCIDSASSVMREAAGQLPSSPSAAAKLSLQDVRTAVGYSAPASSEQQKRPPAPPASQKKPQVALTTQAGNHSSSVGAFGGAQWLLSAADAWRPTAAEFEANCKVVSKLGRGTNTDVYDVKCKGGHMVLKVVRPTRSAAPVDALLPELVLFREARALKQCKHSNIVRCRGLVRVPAGVKCLGDPNSHWAMLQEMLPGGSLAHLILRQMGAPSFPVYSTTDALNWALDVAHAVAHMHAQRPLLVHGDLRLENVLLAKGAEPGARKVAKLTDLGQHMLVAPAKGTSSERVDQQRRQQQQEQEQQQRPAKRTTSPRVSSVAADKLFESLTAPDKRGKGVCCLDAVAVSSGVARARLPADASVLTSTHMYMAPEVFRREPYNEKADIFSLGVIVYQLLARSLLLLSELRAANTADDEQFAAKVAQGYRAGRLPDAPAQLWAIIERCWAQEAKNRPDISWVVQQLQVALEEEVRAVAAGGGFKPVCQSVPISVRGAYKGRQSGGSTSGSKQSNGAVSANKQNGTCNGSSSNGSSSNESASGSNGKAGAAAAGGGGGCCVIS